VDDPKILEEVGAEIVDDEQQIFNDEASIRWRFPEDRKGVLKQEKDER
jgi:hypothetical protein